MPISPSLSKDVVLHCPVCLRERGELIHYAPRQSHCVVCQSESLEPLALVSEEPVYVPEDVLRDPAASFWLKDALGSALSRDPVDAANDADVLARLLDGRCRSILNRIDGPLKNSVSGGKHA